MNLGDEYKLAVGCWREALRVAVGAVRYAELLDGKEVVLAALPR